MKACKSIYHKRHCLNPCLIEFLWQALLVIVFLNGCGSSQPHVADNPASQRFRDETLLPKQSSSHRQAIFFRADQDALPDLVVLNEAAPGKPQLQIFINHGKKWPVSGKNFVQEIMLHRENAGWQDYPQHGVGRPHTH